MARFDLEAWQTRSVCPRRVSEGDPHRKEHADPYCVGYFRFELDASTGCWRLDPGVQLGLPPGC